MALYNRSRPETHPDGGGFLFEVRLSDWLRALSPIIDQVNSAVMACDESGRIVVFNAEAERVLSVSRADVLGKPIAHEPGAGGPALVGLSRVLDEALRAGEQYRRQTLRLHEEEDPSILGYTTSSLFSHEDEPLGAVVLFADLTQERARTTAGREEEQLVQMSRLASLITHEVANPLATIQLYANLLLSAPEVNAHEVASVINAEVMKARQRLASIRAGLSPSATDSTSAAGFSNLIPQATRFCAENAEEDTSAQASLAALETQAAVFVPVSAPAASALILNLAEYLRGVTGPSAPRGGLSCNVSAEDDRASLELSRLHSSNSALEAASSPGTAGTADLNLWIARQIVQRARGSLVIEESREQVVVKAVLPRLTPSRLRGLTILVVDDEERLRGLMSRLLGSAGAYPLEAENGFAALELVASEQPAMVVTDAIMPRLDGLKVAEATPPDIPVLIVSGSSSSSLLPETKRKHTASLSKPFSSEELLMSVAYLAWEADL